MLVLDSGGFSLLSERSTRASAWIAELKAAGLWPPVVPTMVLVESLQGHPGRDANANQFLKSVIVDDTVTSAQARRAAELRHRSRSGSAVDALVVVLAEPGGTVLTRDEADITALASVASDVRVELI